LFLIPAVNEMSLNAMVVVLLFLRF